MSIKHFTASLIALVVAAGSPAAAQMQTGPATRTQVGIAVGATVATGLGAALQPDLAVSGWIARPISGAVEWRVELGRERLQLPGGLASLCSAVGFRCDAGLGVTFVGGGLQFVPWAGRKVGPYGYVTAGLRHLSAKAEVGRARGGWFQFSDSWSGNAFGASLGVGVRVRLDQRWSVRAELRYSGFECGRGGLGWTSLITPAFSVSAGF